MISNIVLLSQDSQYCIFNIETYEIYGIDEFTYHTLNHYLKSFDEADTTCKFNISPEDLKSVLSQIGFKKILKINQEQNYTSFRKINRITLHVSNDCNLRCKYCYASGGSYNKRRELMSESTANQVVNYCCKNFDTINNIVFFGGEPFLNTPIIEFICKSFLKKHEDGQLSQMPKFGAITNGTILNEYTFEVIKKYFSFITISFDGPQPINDINRVFQNGKGSFKFVDEFIKKISTLPKLRVGIEATFTKSHINAGYTHEEIRDFIKSTYKIPVDVIDEISLDNENTSIERIDKQSESPWFYSLLSNIVNKYPAEKCPIMHSTIAISVNGYIYPCHMNVGDNMKPVSTIWKDASEIRSLLETTTTYNLKNNPTCCECWAQNLCGGCSRIYFYNDKNKEYSNIPNTKKCNKFKRIAESTILKICSIRQNSNSWHELLNTLQSSQK